jgi:hypothetical protein
MLDLSSMTKCDQNLSNHCYDFNCSLLHYLSQSWMINRQASEANLLNIYGGKVAQQSVTKIIAIIAIILTTLCRAT